MGGEKLIEFIGKHLVFRVAVAVNIFSHWDTRVVQGVAMQHLVPVVPYAQCKRDNCSNEFFLPPPPSNNYASLIKL